MAKTHYFARLNTNLIKVAISVTAAFILMGAQGEGCGGPDDGGSSGGGSDDGPPLLCGPGEHPELLCLEEHECGEGEIPGCDEVCWPDDACPPGTYEELVCEDYGYYGDPEEPEGEDQGWGSGCDSEGPCEPPEPPGGDCFQVCVPIDECGPDMHEEWICEPVYYPQPVICLDPNGCEEPPPPPEEECFPICVPDHEWCPPGTYPNIECNEYDECWEDCVPEGWDDDDYHGDDEPGEQGEG